jgi:hypothetical protein
MIKKECVCCSQPLKDSIKRYEDYGNYCFDCCMKATRLAHIKGSIKTLYKLLSRGRKIKGEYVPLSQEEREKVEWKVDKKINAMNKIINSLPQYYEGELI